MIELTDEQKQLKKEIIAWYRSFPYGKPYYYYSGAAGTGKTTVIKSIIDDLGLKPDEYMACAYVGKAVLVLLRNGLPASTIHSFIYVPSTTMTYEIMFDDFGNPYKVKKKKHGFVLKQSIPKNIKLIFLDECAMVNDKMRNDLQSFGVPIIMAGDHNQLAPVFGKSSILDQPDFILTQIMRQSEGDPIIYLSQCILNDLPIQYGVYGDSRVIESVPFERNLLDDYDIILCPKNKTRDDINDHIRMNILGYQDRVPVVGDKVICRKNNREEQLDGIYLTNGLVGNLTDVNLCSLYRNIVYGNFKPDFMEKEFKKLTIDYSYLSSDYKIRKEYEKAFQNDIEFFEYAYAITVHLSQGSEYSRVLYLDGDFGNSDTLKRLRYTAITRARDSITWVKTPDKTRKFFQYNGRNYCLPAA